MRKLTLLIVSLLCYVGVLHAQALVADGVYTLSADENKQRGEMVAADGYDYPVLDGIDLSGYAGNSTAAQTNGQYWYVQCVDASSNTYYIYNIAKGKYLVNENGNVNFGDNPYVWTFVTNAGKPAYLNIKDASKTDKVWLSSGCGRNASQRPVQWDSNNNDGGALYTFTRISDYFATPVAGKFYKIKGDGELPWLTAEATTGGNVKVSKDEAYAGVFLKTQDGIQAVATGKYLGYSGGKYTYSDTELAIELRNSGDYLANYNNRYAVVSGNNYMFNNNNDGIVHESSQQLSLPRLWAFIEVEAPAATVNGVLYETLEAAANAVQAGQTLTLWKNSDETYVLPMGVDLKKNGFTADNVTVAQPVAKVGDVEYATLASAVEAANAGETVTLLRNINLGDLSSAVVVKKSITIDGQGSCTITINSVNDSWNKAAFAPRGPISYTFKNLTIDLKNAASDMAAFNMKYGGTLENVTVKGAFGQAVSVTMAYPVTVTNCKFDGATWGVYASSSGVKVNVTGTTFNTTGAVYLHQYGEMVFTDNIVAADSYIETEATVDVSKNFWNGNNATGVAPAVTQLKGDNIICDTYYATNENGVLGDLTDNGVAEEPVIEIVLDGETYEYGSSKLSLISKLLGSSTQANAKITLLDNVTLENGMQIAAYIEDGTLAITPKNVEINLNGKTLNGFVQINANVTATIKNGTINGTNNTYPGVDVAGKVTLDKVTINAANDVRVSSEAELIASVKVGKTYFASLQAAIDAVQNGDVTVEILDKVTLNQSLTGNYNSIKFVGKAATAARSTESTAEIYLDVQGYITATGKKVAFEGLTLSKSQGGFINNAGFMNVAFGVYDVNEVTYTNCTFANGAYAAAGKVTYTGCTFKRSHDKYGLWAYGNVDVTVDGCTFADYRGIKMYAENGAAASVEKANLTVKNTNFSAVDNKPAIVLTYGESVTLENNTYSSTGTFELDLNGAPNGVAVTSDVAPTCKNDNGACGVLVDGRIYTTVAQAAAVATSSSTVTLLHNSTETVVFPMGTTLNKGGFTANNVTVAAPVAKIGETGYATIAAAIEAAQAGDEVVVIANIADVTVDVTKNLTISGTAKLNNVAINANGADALTVKGLTFTGNSWINSGTAEALTVSGVTATVNPSNDAYINSRSAFISLGRSEQQTLALTVENCNITVTSSGPDAILGWAAITKATITGNVIKGSNNGYFTNADAIKFMAIADGAKFEIKNNEIWSNYNGIVFAQNTTRDNAYSVSVDANKFYGEADHVWIEITGGNTVHATVNATSANTVNGNAFTVNDIKYHSNVIKTWSSYAGVDVVTNNNGKVIGGTLASYSNKECIADGYEMGTDGAVAKSSIAEVNGVKYASLEEAVAAVQAGKTITLIADATLSAELTLPAGITLDGNGKQINGTIYAGGDLTFVGHTKVTSFSASYYDRVITIGEGACLEITGGGRVSLAYGNTFNITGSIENAKTANKANVQPSLIIPAGISITGGSDATMNVTNAYVQIGSTTSKNSAANGTFNLNFTNSIVEFTKEFALAEPTSGKNPTFNVNIKDCVFTTGTKFIAAAPNSNVVVDNSNVTLGTYFRNSGKFDIVNGSEFAGSTIQFGENGGNNGAITVDNSKLAITASSSGHAFDGKDTGSITLKNKATASVDYVKDMAIKVDATAGYELPTTVFKCNSFIGKVAINVDGADYEYKDGSIVIKALPVAKIGEQGYASLEAAFATAAEGATITLLDNASPALTSQRAITKAAVIDLGGKTLTLTEDDLYFGTTTFKNGTIVVDPSVNASTAVFWMFENQTLTFDNVDIVATGVTGTYLIGINGGTGTAVNLLNGSSITIANETKAGLTAVICDNGTGNNVTIENSKIDVKNIEGRFYLGGKNGAVVVENTNVDLNGVKEGFYLRAGQSLAVTGTTTVDITLNSTEGRYGINLTDLTATYTKAETATVNSTLFEHSKGSITPAFTGTTSIWGEGGGNAKQSLVVKLYSNETLLATASLNNIGGIINGNVYVSWNIPLNSAGNDQYWNVEWSNFVTLTTMPTKVVMVIDGKEVAENNFQLNSPDDLNKIVAAATDADGKILSCHTSVANAVAANAQNIALLRNTEETIMLPNGVTLNNNGFTANNVTTPVALVNGVAYASLQAAIDAVQEGEEIVILKAGTYALKVKNNVTITGAVAGVEFANIGAFGCNGANVTFNNVTFTYAENSTYKGLQHSGNLVYNNCTINGQVFLYGQSETFNKCVFNTTDSNNYNVWTYGAKEVAFNECTFNCAGKSVLIYAESASITNNVTVTKSQFNASQAVEGKAAIEMDSSLSGAINLTIDSETTADGFGNGNVSGNPLWNNKKGNKTEENNDITVTVNNEVVLKPIVLSLSGTGTEADPYLINNVEELLWFQANVDKQAADGSTQYAGKYIKLTADIDLAGINWNPIGSKTGDHASFKGVFDGDGHKISNLYVEQAGEGLGLFAYTSGNAVIKNLNLVNVTVKSKNNSNYVGGVVGNAYASTKIENVHVSGNVLISGRGYIGGIAGHGYVVMDKVSVVANEGGLITSTFWCAGGVLGYAGEGTTNIMNAHVEGLTITSAAGGLGAIVGMAEDNNGTQPISGSNLSAKNVEIKTYVGGYGTSYQDYAIGYLYGGNETSKLTGTLSVENVTLTNASGNVPATIVDAVATVDGTVYFDFAAAVAAAADGKTIKLFKDVVVAKAFAINGKEFTLDGNGKTISQAADCTNTYALFDINGGKVTIKNVTFDGVKGGAVVRTVGTEFAMDNVTAQNCEHTQQQGLFRLVGKNTITNSTFKNNECSMVLTLNYDAASNTPQVVDNCLFEGNTVNGTAALYYVKGAGFTLKNSEFVNNTVNCNSNGATIYLGFTENNVVTGNLFQNNTVTDASTSTRVAGAIFFGHAANVSGNAFIGNTASNANGDVLGQVCTSTYYNCTIDLSGNYWGDEAPVYGKDYTIQHQTGEGTFALDNYYSDSTLETLVEISYAAKVGKLGYASIKDAVAAVKEGETITILAGTHSEGTIKLPATLKNVTIKGAASVARSTEETILKNMTISAADGNSYSYVGLTFDGITFDNSRILLTGWRNGDEVIENLTVTNCTFKNLNDNTNTAPVHINKDAAEAVKNFTFTNNVIDGATGGSKSGIYLQATGNVVVENNVINNVSFRPYVIQVTTDDGIADTFTVTGNTFSGSAVGRAQGLGNNAEGTDAVNLVVSNNIFKGITDAQQICYWNFNEETTTADLSGNYYDIDILANPGKIYYNGAAAGMSDLVAMGVFPVYTALNEDGTIDSDSAFGVTKVSTKAELATAIVQAVDGSYIIMTADIDYGTDQFAIAKAITLDLGGYTLTTANAYGGMSIKNNPTVKNGIIVHKSNTAAIKVWNATAFEDLVIDVQGKGDANKTIGGIVLQSGSTTRVGSIKNVEIKGAALTNGIETYNCGDATENVIGAMENVTIDAQGTGMLISAPCGTATNCDIKGGVNGVEIFIKGNYSASLDLVNSKVDGGVYAHDEFSSNPSIVNNGTLKFTADEATTGAAAEDVTLEIARAENVQGVLEEVMEAAQAKVNNVYHATVAGAIKAAKAGDVVTVFAGTYTMPSMKAGITIVGEGEVVFEGTLTGTLENLTMKNIHIKGGNAQRWAYAKGNLVFENVTFEATSVYALHFDGITEGATLTYKNCTIIGWAALGGSPASCVFDGCTIKGNGTYGLIRTYFATTIEDCTFDVANVNTTDNYQDGIHAVEGAIVTVTGCTNANGDMKDIVNVHATSVVVLDGEKIQNVAKIGDKYYLTVTEAINAAENGATVEILAGTIDEAIAPWAGDSQHKLEKSITIVGAENFGTTLTGGVFLGYNDGTVRDNTITVKGINFVGKGVVVANQKNVVIEGNKFTDISAKVSDKHGNSNSAILVIGSTKDMSVVATIKDNVIENVANAGIYLSQAGAVVVEGNTVTGTQHNALTVSAATTSSVDVKNNTFVQWGLGGEGRAVRISGATVTVNGNVMSYEGNAPEEFVKVAGATSVNAAENYWNGVTPMNTNVFTSNIDSDPALQLVSYYTDAEKQNLAAISSSAARVGDIYYASLLEAIAAVQDGQTIDLVTDVTMSYGAREAFETNASTVVINGNGHALTLNQTNSDWSSFGLANNSKLVLNNMTINKSGKGATSGAWNTHAIIFSCPVKMNEVTVNNAVAVAADATLNNVAINEANGYYGLWIEANGQTVAVNGGSITATNGGRGIKIADQYIAEPAQVTLSVDGTVFSTAEKAAVLVSSTAGAKIAANNVNIENVADDKVNFVWVDEDWAAHFAAVEVTGATVAQEGIESFVAAITVGEAVKAYYNTLAAAVAAAQNGETVELLANVTLAGGYEDATEGLRIEREITLNGNGHTIDCGTFQKGIRIYNLGTDVDFHVNFNNVEVVNNVANGRCIDTRSHDINLTITDSKLIAQNGNSQPLTIGGSEAIQRVKLDDAIIDAGNSGYGVIAFVPVKQNIYAYDNTKVTGYAAFYLKDHGNANIKLSLGKGTYIGKNIHSGASNAFGTVVLEGDNNVLQILGTNPILKAITEGNASQAVVLVIGANNKVSLESESATIDIEGENAYYGMISAENAGTTTIINKGNTMFPVAEVDGFQFMTIKEAIRYAGNEGTIKIVNDFVLAEAWTIPAGKKYTLDLNGKTVSYTSAVAGEDMITNRGNLTITDSSDAKTGKLAYVNTDTTASNVTVSTISTEAGSTLVVDGGTIENKTVKADGSSIYSFAIDILTNGNLGNVNVTINGGTVYSDYMAIRQFNNGTACKNSLTINGGYIYGAKRAVQVHMDNNAAVTAINGGKVEAGEGGYAICNFAATSNLAVTGGEFIGAVYSARENFISGGIYDAEVYAGYCAEGYMPNKNTNGTYGVVLVANAYASIDGVTYGSLKAAVAAAKAGETITLLQDVKESVTISKNLTIDGAGKTITGMITTDGKGLNVTIKNVKFDGNNKTINYAMRADDNNNLVVENCSASNYIYGFLYANKSNDKIVVKNVTVEGCAEYGAYLVSFNKATFENFEVKGTTKYGIAVANAGARNVTLKNVSFEDAETPLSISEIGTGKVTFNFSGVNEMSKAEFYTSQYVNVVAVAQVGTKVCGSLQDAVVAANDGDTVKVIADVNMTTANFVTQVDGYATLVNVQGKAVTIDLNGKKVTVNANAADLTGAKGSMLMSVFHADPNGTLTLTDSSAEGTGTVELFANDAKVYGLIVSENAYDKSHPGKIIVNGGNYIADKLSDSMVFADISEAITVNGGNFHLGNIGETGVNGKPWIFNASGNNEKYINVNGGTYNANVAKQYWANEVNLGEGLTTTNNGDGTWTVVPAVASVGEETFGSIQEAIDAAQDGQTVKLIADVTYGDDDVVLYDNMKVMNYVAGKNITLDMNGKTIDVTYNGGKHLLGVILVEDGAGLTVVGNGNINLTGTVGNGKKEQNIAYMFYKRGTTGYLVIENGTFHMNDAADSMVYTNGDEIVTINGGTFILDAVASQTNGFPVIFSTAGNNEKQIIVNAGTFNYDINHQIRPFEVYVAPEKAVKKVDDMWTIVPAQAYVTEKLGQWVYEAGQYEHKVGYATVNEAIAAFNSELAENVTILAGEYTGNLNVNKAITVKGETDEEGNNLVTFNGRLNISADGATVKNLNFTNASGKAAQIGAKNVTIDGCSLVGSNGLYQSYTSGLVTFKNSYIKGGTYGIHFDGNAGGNIVIENCTVIGWTSFAGTIENVAISGTTFAEGSQNQLRFYQNAQLTGCTFNEKMNIDFGKNETTAEFNNCSVENGKALTDVIYIADIAEMGVKVTIDGVPVCVAAKVNSKYYLSLQAAIDAATEGQTVTVVSNLALTEGVTVAADDKIFIDLNGKTITGTPTEAKAYAVITNKGTLTIEGEGAIVCNHTLAGSTSYAVNTIVNSGDLTIDGATIENKSTASNQIGYAIDNNSTSADATVTVVSGNVTVSGSNYYDGIRQFANSTTAENNVIVRGGKVSSIWMQNPSDGATKNTKDVNGSVTIEGGEVTALYLEPSANFEAAITAGHVGNVSYFETAEGRDLKEFVTGGTFGTLISENFLAWGYQLTGDAAPYTVEWTGARAEVTFIDGEFTEYTNENNIEVGILTYKRTISAAWQAFYVPFQVPVDSLAKQGFEVAYINGVRRSDYNEDGEFDSGFSMELIMIHGGKGNANGSGKTLKANYPYFIRPVGTVSKELTIVLKDALLYAAEDVTYDCSTFAEKFEITGNSSQVVVNSTDDEFRYVVTSKGEWSKRTTPGNVKPFRFYMTVTSRDGSSPLVAEPSMSIVVRGEELPDGTTVIYDVNVENGEDVIYDLNGRRVLKTEKGGIYIKGGKKFIAQ